LNGFVRHATMIERDQPCALSSKLTRIDMDSRQFSPDHDRFTSLKRMVPRRRRNGAITLIELLVALGIIVALMAILIPMLSRGAATGRRATCMTQQRQVSQLIDDFLVDSFMRFPMQPEPEDENPFIMPGAAIGRSDEMPMSYAFNAEFLARRIAMTQITGVTTTLLLYDGFAGSDNGTGDGNGLTHSPNQQRVSVLHKPLGPNPKVLPVQILALDAHLSHDDAVGSWDDSMPAFSLTDLTIDDHNPRHQVTGGVGVVTFVDGHAEFRPRLDASMFLAPDPNPANMP
jgi:hypothetical protein